MYSKGEYIFVEDRGQNYKCKIIETDPTRLKVHYVNWKSTYDEWIDMNSSRINNFDDYENREETVDALESYIDSVAAAVKLPKGQGLEEHADKKCQDAAKHPEEQHSA